MVSKGLFENSDNCLLSVTGNRPDPRHTSHIMEVWVLILRHQATMTWPNILDEIDTQDVSGPAIGYIPFPVTVDDG